MDFKLDAVINSDHMYGSIGLRSIWCVMQNELTEHSKQQSFQIQFQDMLVYAD